MKYLDVPQSGSLAGRTYSHNRAGQYVRNRRAPVQPVGNGRRSFIRAAFGSQASGFAALTVAQQAAWASAAASHPVTDSLGQAIFLTAQQLFVSVNTALLNAGAAVVTAPPGTFAVFSEGAFTFTAVSAGAITVTLAGAGAVGDFSLIAFSQPLPGGRTFWKTFNQFTHQAGNSVVPYVATTPYHNQFGVPPVGTRIFCKVTPVSSLGVTGTPVIQFATVT
jgi:hypothetical protein